MTDKLRDAAPLLPCPFCGDDGDKGTQAVTLMNAERTSFRRVSCRCCGATCPEPNWNHRAALAQQDAQSLVEAVRAEPTEMIHKWRVLELIQAHDPTPTAQQDAQAVPPKVWPDVKLPKPELLVWRGGKLHGAGFSAKQVRKCAKDYALSMLNAAPTLPAQQEWIDDAGRLRWALWRIKDLEQQLSGRSAAIAPPSQSDDEHLLRLLLAVRVAGPGLYTDDGEMSDCSASPHIDFKRDSVKEIERKLIERGMAKAWGSIGELLATKTSADDQSDGGRS